MAWDAGKSENGRLVYSETLTLSNASTANGSKIDFVDKDDDFVVYLNTGSTATAAAVTTDLEGSFDGTTWADINASFGSDLNAAMVIVTYDASSSGDFPYYRLTFDSVGNDAANDITVKVSV